MGKHLTGPQESVCVVDYKPFCICNQFPDSESLQEQPSSFTVNLFGFQEGCVCVCVFCFENVLSCTPKSFLNVSGKSKYCPLRLCSLPAPELRKLIKMG